MYVVESTGVFLSTEKASVSRNKSTAEREQKCADAAF